MSNATQTLRPSDVTAPKGVATVPIQAVIDFVATMRGVDLPTATSIVRRGLDRLSAHLYADHTMANAQIPALMDYARTARIV